MIEARSQLSLIVPETKTDVSGGEADEETVLIVRDENEEPDLEEQTVKTAQV
jgi:hypothetical protein